MKIPIKFKKTDPAAKLPVYSTEGSVGADLYSMKRYFIAPGQTAMIDTGLQLAEMSLDYELQVRPRSSLAVKHRVTVANTPGTIDGDYRGACKVILINHGHAPYVVQPGDRIAQLVVAPRTLGDFSFTKEVVDTERGAGGFGSTGK